MRNNAVVPGVTSLIRWQSHWHVVRQSWPFFQNDFAGRIARMPAADRRARTAELLDHIGLADRAHERVGGWSMGMRKKLAVARAMYSIVRARSPRVSTTSGPRVRT